MTNKYFPNGGIADQAPLETFSADTVQLAEKDGMMVAVGNYRVSLIMIPNSAENWGSNAEISWVAPGIMRLTGQFVSSSADNSATMGFFPYGFRPEAGKFVQSSTISENPFVTVVTDPTLGSNGGIKCTTPAGVDEIVNVDMFIVGNMNQ